MPHEWLRNIKLYIVLGALPHWQPLGHWVKSQDMQLVLPPVVYLPVALHLVSVVPELVHSVAGHQLVLEVLGLVKPAVCQQCVAVVQELAIVAGYQEQHPDLFQGYGSHSSGR